MDKYTWHLVKLCALSDERLRAIVPNTVEFKWLIELFKAISPPPDFEVERVTDWQRYFPIRILKKGGEGLVILAEDRELQKSTQNKEIVIKIALPIVPRERETTAEEKPKAVFAKAKDMIKNLSLYTPQPQIIEKEKHTTEETLRFERGFLLQGQLHAVVLRKGLQQIGYIPGVYTFSEPPNLWYSMEYVPGQGLLDWCKDKTETQILAKFTQIVKFIEEALHNCGVVHTDLAPKNFLVLQNLPILLDFGIAKSLKDASITSPCSKAQLGTPLYAPAEQIEHSVERDFQSDIFALGRILWSMWEKTEPDKSKIVVTHTDGGRIEIDFAAIAALFPANVFPFDLRYIFEKSTTDERELRYKDISEMRKDLDSLLSTHTKTNICETCKYDAITRKVLKILEGE